MGGREEGRKGKLQWLTPVILATWKAERISVAGQPRQKIRKTPS
jgi:hypothetical protein